jgi:protoporphyrinogen oxidase
MAMDRPHVIVMGGGFTGLSAAYDLVCRGIEVTVLEEEEQPGGLAGSFMVAGQPVEKFYHHWFNHDQEIFKLAADLGVEDRLLRRSSRTGMYIDGRIFRLATPLDLLRFSPLGLMDRIRLGLLVLKVRRVKNWRDLEHLTAAAWLRQVCGAAVYQVVWEPLLRGKFGPYAEEVSAVWFWNKLVLRGGSRSSGGKEELVYFQGGFAAFVEKLAEAIIAKGGKIKLRCPVTGLTGDGGRLTGVVSPVGEFYADAVVATLPLPLLADLAGSHLPENILEKLRNFKYLANLCLVLELDRPLSAIYWLNVSDPDFPFVGVIEHTNFEPPETYGGRHLVYLSRYLPETDLWWQLTDDQILERALVHVKRLFPHFEPAALLGWRVFRARFSQPVVVRHYSRLVSGLEAPLAGLFLASMAQIYPEDRGTNYAVREGRRIARRTADWLLHGKQAFPPLSSFRDQA